MSSCSTARPQKGGREEEEEEEEEEQQYDDLPSKILAYPDTDEEGEPQVKYAWELWPVPAPKPKRKHARTPAAVLGRASAVPGPSARILGTRPREGRQQAAGQAPTPVVVRRPPGIHDFPVAKETLATPATATWTGPPGAGQSPTPVVVQRPPGIHALPVAKETLAAPATATWTPPPGVHSVQVATEAVVASAAAARVAAAGAFATAPAARETGAHAAHQWRASRQARRANQPTVTTLVVRNLHVLVSQQEFLDEVNRSGFAERYDFAYLPRNFEDGAGKGHAFINFKSAEAASTFAAAWHRSRSGRLCTEDEAGQVAPLNVSRATKQGLEANLREWTHARLTRVKNPDYLPFVLGGANPEPPQAAGAMPR